MTYQIVENDVRLLRRIMVANKLGFDAAAKAIENHLREKGLKFVLPEDQTADEQRRYLSTLYPEAFELATEHGFIILPEYGEVIFLNSKWRNPKTLYVRLVHKVPELGELGAVCWTPEKDKYPDLDLFIQAYEENRRLRDAPPSRANRFKKWIEHLTP